MGTTAIILAAGKGKRMNSAMPKVLHPIGGLPMLHHVITTAQEAHIDQAIVVYGHGGNKVLQSKALESADVEWVEQLEQLGTAHAVEQALPRVDPKNLVLVLYGDTPLLEKATIERLLTAHKDENQLTVLTFIANDPTGYGRIIRDDNSQIKKIVEQKDATEEELTVQEVNSGVMLATSSCFKEWIKDIEDNNQQQEFYLTDCVAIARKRNLPVLAVNCEDPSEVSGVNDRMQLAEVEKIYQNRMRKKLALQGVTFQDIETVYVNGKVKVGKDILIGPGVELYGNILIGDQVVIESNCKLIDTEIGQNTVIHSMSHIENAQIGTNCEVGPYARLRPQTKLDSNVKIGNFVEVKKATINQGSKVNHLSYIGDCKMGENVNIGAGTITCNYDGANKHQTIIGDKVFIGSDTQLVAPVQIGDGATIGAGSTITKDVPAEKLTLSRAKQITLENWIRPKKSK